MRSSLTALSTLFLGLANLVHAAEPIAAEPQPVAQPTSSASAITPAAAALHQYFYIDFPRQLQATQNEIELAEAELHFIARRIESYRPFASFGPYAATYMAEHSWGVALLAAEHRLACLRLEQADLWRQRRVLAEALITR